MRAYKYNEKYGSLIRYDDTNGNIVFMIMELKLLQNMIFIMVNGNAYVQIMEFIQMLHHIQMYFGLIEIMEIFLIW